MPPLRVLTRSVLLCCLDAPGPPPPSGDYGAKPKSSAAGLGAVFAELTKKGDGVTKGLNTVTKDMKNALKNA